MYKRQIDSHIGNLHHEIRDETMVCAGELDGSTMACNGDSGGPLVCMRGNQPVVYGVTSWAIPGCSYSGSAPLFARVGHFREWINEKAQEFVTREPYPVVSKKC